MNPKSGPSTSILDGLDRDEQPMLPVAELKEAGDQESSPELLMAILAVDLRCLDAHAHLGHLNRPFLRCLHGYGLCLWRLGRSSEAKEILERNLGLNPIDNQGVRFCWEAVCAGEAWEEMQRRETRGERRRLH